MNKSKVTLVKKNSEEKAPEMEIQAEIHSLRAQARLLLEENNAIVKQIWDIEYELSVPEITQDKKQLKKQKDALQEQIKSKQLPQKIQTLLDEIEKKEKEAFGHSDVNSNSPYTL